jgi:predicted amidohydrolase
MFDEELPTQRVARNSVLPEDVQARLGHVARMLDIVHPLSRADEQKCLKIFLMPEWSFGLQRKAGYYTKDQMEQVRDGFAELSAQARFKDYLFVPGSVCWALPGTGPKQVYNTVFVFHRGEVVHTYHKQHNAGDAEPGDRMPLDMDEKTDVIDKWLKDPAQVGFNCKPEALSSLFTFDGRRFGIEVCADQARGVVLREYIHREKYSALAEGLDIHLIVGCGTVVLQKFATAAKVGGYAVLCEGNPRLAATNEKLQVVYQMSERSTKELLPRVQNYNSDVAEEQRSIQWMECHSRIVGDEDALAHRSFVSGRLRLPPVLVHT